MNAEVLQFIETEFPKILSKYPLENYDSTDWYEKRLLFLEYNKKVLEDLSRNLKEKLDVSSTYQELFSMQKLFLIYPERIPKKLLSLSWEKVQMILKLCEREKRDFYVDMSIQYHWSDEQLKKYILEDLYEKTITVMEEVKDYSVVTAPDFREQILEVAMMIWK